jgi:molybdopterin synthase sulfur carrier subunit
VTINVQLFATLRLALKCAGVTIETEGPVTVGALIDLISKEVGEDIRPWLVDENDTIHMGTMILLDGKNMIHLDGLDTLVETPNVAVFPPAGGG